MLKILEAIAHLMLVRRKGDSVDPENLDYVKGLTADDLKEVRARGFVDGQNTDESPLHLTQSGRLHMEFLQREPDAELEPLREGAPAENADAPGVDAAASQTAPASSENPAD